MDSGNQRLPSTPPHTVPVDTQPDPNWKNAIDDNQRLTIAQHLLTKLQQTYNIGINMAIRQKVSRWEGQAYNTATSRNHYLSMIANRVTEAQNDARASLASTPSAVSAPVPTPPSYAGYPAAARPVTSTPVSAASATGATAARGGGGRGRGRPRGRGRARGGIARTAPSAASSLPGNGTSAAGGMTHEMLMNLQRQQQQQQQQQQALVAQQQRAALARQQQQNHLQQQFIRQQQVQQQQAAAAAAARNRAVQRPQQPQQPNVPVAAANAHGAVRAQHRPGVKEKLMDYYKKYGNILAQLKPHLPTFIQAHPKEKHEMVKKKLQHCVIIMGWAKNPAIANPSLTPQHIDGCIETLNIFFTWYRQQHARRQAQAKAAANATANANAAGRTAVAPTATAAVAHQAAAATAAAVVSVATTAVAAQNTQAAALQQQQRIHQAQLQQAQLRQLQAQRLRNQTNANQQAHAQLRAQAQVQAQAHAQIQAAAIAQAQSQAAAAGKLAQAQAQVQRGVPVKQPAVTAHRTQPNQQQTQRARPLTTTAAAGVTGISDAEARKQLEAARKKAKLKLWEERMERVILFTQKLAQHADDEIAKYEKQEKFKRARARNTLKLLMDISAQEDKKRKASGEAPAADTGNDNDGNQDDTVAPVNTFVCSADEPLRMAKKRQRTSKWSKQLIDLVLRDCEAAKNEMKQVRYKVKEEFGLPVVECNLNISQVKMPTLTLRVQRGYPTTSAVTYGFQIPPLGWVDQVKEARDEFRRAVNRAPTNNIGVANLLQMWAKAAEEAVKEKE